MNHAYTHFIERKKNTNKWKKEEKTKKKHTHITSNDWNCWAVKDQTRIVNGINIEK